MLISDLKKQRRKNDFAPNRINSHKSNRAGQIKKKCALITWWRRRIFFPFSFENYYFSFSPFGKAHLGAESKFFFLHARSSRGVPIINLGMGCRGGAWDTNPPTLLAPRKKKAGQETKINDPAFPFPSFFSFFSMSAPDFDSEECVNQVPIDSFHLVLRFSRVWRRPRENYFFQGKDLGVLAKCLAFLQCEKNTCLCFVSE